MGTSPTLYSPLSLEHVRTFSVRTRRNLVTIDNMARPGVDPAPDWDADGLGAVVDAIVLARKRGRPVIWSMGAHVIKNGLSRYIIALVQRGVVTHVAGNGATSIHDFELAMLGATSEDVASSIEDGSFGMWEETGRFMNVAIQEGVRRGLGYGASLAAYTAARSDDFPHLSDCVFAQTAAAGAPYTCHITIGTDIIHQHPAVDFAALGLASGIDFGLFCESIRDLRDGVFLNFGSAVSGPHLLKRALAAAYNTGDCPSGFTVANFDIRPLRGVAFRDEEGVHPSPADDALIRLPPLLGGVGYHFAGLHQETIPGLYARIMERWGE